MKFLVLALCVCAASAASFGSSSFGGYKNYKGYQKPQAAVAPVAAVAPAPVPAPVPAAAKAVAQAFAPVAAPFAVAAEATYQAGNAAYQTAKQVISKGYSADGQAAILRSESESSPEGFKSSYETDNGIQQSVEGITRQVGDSVVVISRGSYKYNAPDGTPVFVTYTADENGYHPQGDLLPVAPEIPEAILRSIAYNAAHAKDSVQKY